MKILTVNEYYYDTNNGIYYDDSSGNKLQGSICLNFTKFDLGYEIVHFIDGHKIFFYDNAIVLKYKYKI